MISQAWYLLSCHIRYYWKRVVLLVGALFFVCVIPFGVERAVHWYAEEFHERAELSPLLVGKRGNRFDLVLASLYFQTNYSDRITVGESDEAYNRDYGLPIPFLLGHAIRSASSESASTNEVPLVAVDPEYYSFRTVELTSGSLPVLPGDILLGADAAVQLGVAVGDRVVNVPQSTLDFSRAAQYAMRVCGILKANGTADDRAAFSGLQTAWILEGIGHGHDEATQLVEQGQGLASESAVQLSAGVTTYNEINQETLSSFHFHGAPEGYPISAFLLVPETVKQRTLAIGYYRLQEAIQLVVPLEVIQELFQVVFQMKRYFYMQASGMMLVAVLLILFIARLSQELRKQEMKALHRIGAPRLIMSLLSYGELIVVFLLSVGGAYAVSQCIPWLIETMYW